MNRKQEQATDESSHWIENNNRSCPKKPLPVSARGLKFEGGTENMIGTHNFPALIRQLQSELDQDGERWQARAHERAQEIVSGKLESPHELLDWAKQDRHWSFTLAEVMHEVCAKPSELATRLLIAIVEELRDEQQTVGSLAD